ncbi:MAG: hypothetical protein A3E85_01705 [Gammaproteobacteria bacterium RIFCSPHIGHO2_12_FULL_45_12]|nr:MAG: hypothetical protein A3E85_01705 [Gammaproteobacteria bacterium RIFCSPHIGHO2_12_FULL_45_12]
MNSQRHSLFIVIFWLGLATAAQAIGQDPYPFASLKAAQRFQALTKEIRCVVCQNQNIADSNAPLANDLRDKVYQMVKANLSDHDIKEYMVKRYGEFILLRPRLSKLTAPLWLLPLLGFITAIASLVWLFPRQKSHKDG